MPQEMVYSDLHYSKHDKIHFNVYTIEQTFWVVIIFVRPASFPGRNPKLPDEIFSTRAIHHI